MSVCFSLFIFFIINLKNFKPTFDGGLKSYINEL